VSDETFSGGCLCGQVRFTVQSPTLWCAHCHCSLCRKAHGAAWVTWVGAADSRAVIDAAAGALSWYASTPEAERGFCRHCGSTIFFRSSRWPGELHITHASFDAAIDRDPSAHVWWDQHVDWAEPGDSLPRKPS
jgi:hypothetical protein